jgi:hypothetical protein
MNRRVFASGLAVTSFAFATRASAQEASPGASPEATVVARYILSDQPGFVRAVVRNFQVTEDGSASILEGGPVLMQTSGAEFETPGDASNGLNYLRTALPASLGAENAGATGVETEEISVGEPGEERFGMQIDVTFAEGAVFQELAFGALVIRNDRVLQVLLAGGLEPGWDAIQQSGNATEGRWPSSDLWQSVPDVEDVPVSLAVSEEREVLPGQ